MATKTFTVAAKEFFGLKDGQKLTGFASELKALTHEDKLEMAPLLGAELGCEVKVSDPKADA